MSCTVTDYNRWYTYSMITPTTHTFTPASTTFLANEREHEVKVNTSTNFQGVLIFVDFNASVKFIYRNEDIMYNLQVHVHLEISKFHHLENL